ncbi:MAG: hypothetical protein P1P88_11405 [Bacteroidales bacterium]|nr:hypothetical protein [Bacteroidales bacterium]
MNRLLTNLGGFLAISGIISCILYFIDYQLKILAWIDTWGNTMGWVIRIGLILVGLALFFIAGQTANKGSEGNDN